MSSQVDEEGLQVLEKVLSVSLENLQALATSDEFSIVVDQIASYVSKTQNEVSDYESTLNELTVEIGKRDQLMGE